jgi:hypothetical protein
MAILQVFKATLPSINYIFRNGKPAIFVQGKYATGVEGEIDELKDEISKGHPHIYIDAAESEVDSEMVDPIQALRTKIEAQIRAEMAAATDLNNDRGQTKQEPLKPSSSTDVMDAAAGGSGVGLAARLMKVGK